MSTAKVSHHPSQNRCWNKGPQSRMSWRSQEGRGEAWPRTHDQSREGLPQHRCRQGGSWKGDTCFAQQWEELSCSLRVSWPSCHGSTRAHPSSSDHSQSLPPHSRAELPCSWGHAPYHHGSKWDPHVLFVPLTLHPTSLCTGETSSRVRGPLMSL